jgi:hypothetical protein
LKKFDISPFALPNCPPGEIWFEESRDVLEVVVQFRNTVPREIGVHYLQDKWPNTRHEERRDRENPAAFGWVETDDWFNGKWRQAKVRKEVSGKTATLRFRGLLADGIEGTPKPGVSSAPWPEAGGARLEPGPEDRCLYHLSPGPAPLAS